MLVVAKFWYIQLTLEKNTLTYFEVVHFFGLEEFQTGYCFRETWPFKQDGGEKKVQFKVNDITKI